MQPVYSSSVPVFPFLLAVPLNERNIYTMIPVTKKKRKKRKKVTKSRLILGCLNNQAVGIIGGCRAYLGTEIDGLEQVCVYGLGCKDPLVVTGGTRKGSVGSSVGIGYGGNAS